MAIASGRGGGERKLGRREIRLGNRERVARWAEVQGEGRDGRVGREGGKLGNVGQWEDGRRGEGDWGGPWGDGERGGGRCEQGRELGAVVVALGSGGGGRWTNGGGGNGIGARGGSGHGGDSGGGGGGGRSPSSIFLEQPLEREFTPFLLQMMARVCGGEGEGEGPFPSYRAQNGPRGERAHLRSMTQSLNMLIEIRRFTKKKGFTSRIPNREEPTRKPKTEREYKQGPA